MSPEAKSVRRERLSQDLALHCLPWTEVLYELMLLVSVVFNDVHDVHDFYGIGGDGEYDDDIDDFRKHTFHDIP